MPKNPAGETVPGGPRTSRVPRLIAVGAVVVVGALAVGAASRPHPVDVALSLPDIGDLTVPLLLLLAAAAGLLVGQNFIAAWAHEPDLQDPNRKKSKVPRVVQVLLPLFLLAVIAFVWMWAGDRARGPAPGAGAGAAAIDVNSAPITGGDIGLLIACALVMVVAALIAAAFFRRHVNPALPPAPSEGVAVILDEGLGALLAESDPRRAVIAAYVAMERAMARQGWARRPAEAPTEYLGRVLRVAPSRSGDLDRLVGLYQVARFSEHPVTGGMRDIAVDAVRRLRADLVAAA
jgi:hypothetical protein